MAKITYEQALDLATQEEVDQMITIIQKKRKFYLLLALIPVVNWFFGGCFTFTNNTYKAIRGQKTGGLLNMIIVIWSFILPPIVIVFFLSRISKCERKVLGIDKIISDIQERNRY